MKKYRLKKFRSFGLIEAIIASVIVILVLAAAVVLSSSSHRSATSDASYQQAENIAEKLFSQIQAMKSAGNTYFFAPANQPVEATRYPIECFDTSVLKNGDAATKKCLDGVKYKDGLPFASWLTKNEYLPGQFDGAYFIIENPGNPQFGPSYFKIKVTVQKLAKCYTKGSVDLGLGADNCRVAKVDVLWSDRQDNHYYSDQYLTAWEK